jgi:L-lactate utilization protein LutC
MGRKEILDRVEAATSHIFPSPLPATAPSFPKYANPIERFRQALEAAGGRWLAGLEEAGMAAAFETILAETGYETICWDDSATLQSAGLQCELLDAPHAEEAAGTLLLSRHPSGKVASPVKLEHAERTPERLANLTITVSRAAWGIAETGTVVEESGPAAGRVLPAFAPVHVALLSVQRIVHNSSVLFQNLKPGESGSSLTLVTGPSRTADIEQTLIVGVHGPKVFYVIITD